MVQSMRWQRRGPHYFGIQPATIRYGTGRSQIESKHTLTTVKRFLEAIKQAEGEDARAQEYIQEKINKFREDALRLKDVAEQGSEQEHIAKMVLRELERVEAYLQSCHEMSSSMWSDSTAARDSSPEHTRPTQSPGRRLSRHTAWEKVPKSPSPPSVSIRSYLETF